MEELVKRVERVVVEKTSKEVVVRLDNWAVDPVSVVNWREETVACVA
jgi:hypothetical protein